MSTMTDDAVLTGRVPLKTPWLLIGAIAFVTVAVAAGLAWRPDSPPPVDPVRASGNATDRAVASGRSQDGRAAAPAQDTPANKAPARPAPEGAGGGA